MAVFLLMTIRITREDPPELQFGLLVNHSLTPEYGPELPVGEGRISATGQVISAIRSHIMVLESMGYLETSGANILYQDHIEGFFRITDAGKQYLERHKGLYQGAHVRFPIAERRVDPTGFLSYEPASNRLLFTYTVKSISPGHKLWSVPSTTYKGCALFRYDRFQKRSIIIGTWGGKLGDDDWRAAHWMDENGEYQQGVRRGMQLSSDICN